MSLFSQSDFVSHSGIPLRWKIDCDALTPDDWSAIAAIVAKHVKFSHVHGVPRGGVAFAAALCDYADPYDTALPLLIVDDVLTTGGSMEEARKLFASPSIGIVLFSRASTCPDWITPVFSLNPMLA